MCVQTTEKLEEASGWCRGADEEMLAGAETILFVEDEAFVRDVTCKVLRSAGYRVLTAKNAAEAVRVYDARRGEVELLLTDVILPGETGRVLAGRLRRKDPELKVLLVTICRADGTARGEARGMFSEAVFQRSAVAESETTAGSHGTRDRDRRSGHARLR